ncbi:DUF6417 family protein [Streptomyces sp. NPDC059755]|uniref:DUF6417 family protein n=1 Tax=Streptomyces sp. NPDC059755 TaxID=3346934 RepID=UPI003666DA6A
MLHSTCGGVTVPAVAALPGHGRRHPPRLDDITFAPVDDDSERLAVLSLAETHDVLSLLLAVAQEGGPLSGQAQWAKEIAARIPSQAWSAPRPVRAVQPARSHAAGCRKAAMPAHTPERRCGACSGAPLVVVVALVLLVFLMGKVRCSRHPAGQRPRRSRRSPGERGPANAARRH